MTPALTVDSEGSSCPLLITSERNRVQQQVETDMSGGSFGHLPSSGVQAPLGTTNSTTYALFFGIPLGTKGIATRSKDATRGSWHYYQEQERYERSKVATVFPCRHPFVHLFGR